MLFCAPNKLKQHFSFQALPIWIKQQFQLVYGWGDCGISQWNILLWFCDSMNLWSEKWGYREVWKANLIVWRVSLSDESPVPFTWFRLPYPTAFIHGMINKHFLHDISQHVSINTFHTILGEIDPFPPIPYPPLPSQPWFIVRGDLIWSGLLLGDLAVLRVIVPRRRWMLNSLSTTGFLHLQVDLI